MTCFIVFSSGRLLREVQCPFGVDDYLQTRERGGDESNEVRLLGYNHERFREKGVSVTYRLAILARERVLALDR